MPVTFYIECTSTGSKMTGDNRQSGPQYVIILHLNQVDEIHCNTNGKLHAWVNGLIDKLFNLGFQPRHRIKKRNECRKKAI